VTRNRPKFCFASMPAGGGQASLAHPRKKFDSLGIIRLAETYGPQVSEKRLENDRFPAYEILSERLLEFKNPGFSTQCCRASVQSFA
jgi:hypothetical protein